MQEIIKQVQEILGYIFNQETLLIQALTHKSFAEENNVPNNERLEFLGDSLLNPIISEFFYREHPDFAEGDLTKIRAKIVKKDTLSKVARQHKLGKYIRLGKGEEASGGHDKNSNLANVVEALIGAIYLDSNFDATKEMVLNLFSGELDSSFDLENYKGKLQEICEKKFSQKPIYKVVAEKGMDHEKIFTIEVNVDEKFSAQGSGQSKRQAEQAAAKEVLYKLVCDNADGTIRDCP